MYRQYILRWTTLSLAFVALVIGYTNCSPFNAGDELAGGVMSSSGAPCPVAPASLKRPTRIQGAIDLINALGKPLTLDCFVANLEKPLGVYAVDNKFSAQPSAGPKSPRILIVSYPLVMTVVPAGEGRFLLEMSELVDAVQSVKAEIQFPIARELVTEDAFSHLVTTGLGQTDCRFCHQNEGPAGGSFPLDARKSDIVRPDSFSRISSASLFQEAQLCKPSLEPYRCAMLRAIYVTGQARDVSFP